jgi:hypothetical protein
MCHLAKSSYSHPCSVYVYRKYLFDYYLLSDKEEGQLKPHKHYCGMRELS